LKNITLIQYLVENGNFLMSFPFISEVPPMKVTQPQMKLLH